mmetsp:Transcript_59618/g.160659  ORF Transcript_59618/g.160659 Transcript_59618/m.160659 type:complete len:109 (-) Transcript_59618:796-1122(-)
MAAHGSAGLARSLHSAVSLASPCVAHRCCVTACLHWMPTCGGCRGGRWATAAWKSSTRRTRYAGDEWQRQRTVADSWSCDIANPFKEQSWSHRFRDSCQQGILAHAEQ